MPTRPINPRHDDVEFIEESQHTNKLRLGHLRGNRFKIRLSGVHPDTSARIPALLVALEQGVPNYFGPQRFGAQTRGFTQSWAWLTNGSYRRKNRWIDRRFAASVVQAALYNRWLYAGDVYKKRETGGLFVGVEPNEEQARLDRGEIDPTGPLYGPKMKSAIDDAGLREDKIKDVCGLEDKHWDVLGRAAPGGRRVARIVPQGFKWVHTPDEGSLTVEFSLPPGAFATTILAEMF